MKNVRSYILAAALVIMFCSACAAPTPPPPEPLYPNLSSILESLAPVANGEGVTEARPYAPDQNGPPKLVILDNSASRPYKSGYEKWNWELSADWLPESLGVVDLVVVIKEQEVKLDSRQYTKGSPITRYRWDLDVVMREAHAGTIVKSVTLKGPEPEAFPEVAPVDKKRLDGDTVQLLDLQEWLVGPSALDGRLNIPHPVGSLGEEEHTDEVNAVAFSPDGKILASGSPDSAIQLWNVKDGTILKTLNWEDSGVKNVVFSPDGNNLVSMSRDAIRIWRVEDGSLLRKFEVEGANSQLAVSPDGKLLALGIYNTVQIWQFDDGAVLKTLKSNAKAVDSVAFSPDGKILASGSEDGSVSLWQVEDGKLVRTINGFEGHSGPVDGLAFSPDGKILAAVDSFTAWLWQVEDGKLLRYIKITSPSFSGNSTFSFSPDGGILAFGAKDMNVVDGLIDAKGYVQLRRVNDGAILSILKDRTPLVGSVAFSPDGTLVATGTEAGSVQLWEIEPGP